MRLKIWLAGVVYAVIFLSACGQSALLPTETMPSLTQTPIPTSTRLPTHTPTQTSQPTETPPPTETPLPSRTPTATPPTYVRENTPIPEPSEPITADSAGRLAELARLGKGRIVDVQLSPDRNYLIVQTTLGIYGYLADRPEEVWRFEDPAGIADMALTRTERWMAVATNDGRIALLIYRRGSMFTRWATGYDEIHDLAFSFDGHSLAAVGDRGVTVWPLGKTEPLYQNPDLTGEMVRFTPDGERLIVATAQEVSIVRLFSAAAEAQVSLSQPGLPVFSQDGAYFSDGFSVWDGRSAEAVLELDTTPKGTGQPEITFSRDARKIAVGLVGSLEVYIWDIEQKELDLILVSPNQETVDQGIGKLSRPVFRPGPGDYFIDAFAFSPDGSQLVVTTGLGWVELWDANSGRYLAGFEGRGNPLYISNTRMALWHDRSLAQFQNGLRLANYSASGFRADGEVFFSANADRLFSGDTIWNLPMLNRILVLDSEKILSVPQDGDRIYALSNDPLKIISRSRTDFSVSEEIALRTPSELCPDWDVGSPIDPILSSTGDFFGAGFFDCGFMFWDLRNNMVTNVNEGPVWSQDFSPDGSLLVLTGGSGTRIYASEDVGGAELISVPDEYVVAFSQDNQKILAVSISGRLTIYSFRFDHLVEDLPLAGELEMDIELLGPAAFSPNNDLLVISNDGFLSLVETASGELLAHIPAHLDQITAVAFSLDGRYLATSSSDGTVKLWGIP